MTVEVMDMTVACQSFPDKCNNYISRSNMVDTLDSILKGSVDVVVIEGDDGIGKTTLMSSFALRNPLNAISFFVNSSSKYGYDIEFVKFDLSNQINWLLTKTELNSSDQVDEGFLRSKIFELQRKARRNNETYFFVIDGIDEIPEENSYIIDLIFELIPFGLPNFKFVFSSRDYCIYRDILENKKVEYKSFPLSAFTFEQTQKYFKDLKIEHTHLLDIHKISKGKPGYLSSLLRLLQSGMDIHEVMDNITEHLPDPFELEWKQVNLNNSRILTLLAVMSNDILNVELPMIKKIVGYESDKKLKEDISGLTFINYNIDSISFVQNAYKRYVGEKLKDYKEDIENRITNHLLIDPASDESLKYLPSILVRTNRHEELVGFLNSENYYNLLQKTQSISVLNQATEMGVSAAEALNRGSELFQFSFQSSVVKQSLKSKIWASEVKARMSLQQYDEAISLAQNSLLIEDRLHMLAIISKHKKLQGLIPEPEIIEQINNLYSKIDYQKLGNKAVEIASELVYTLPDIAIELMEKLTDTNSEENALDWALATLSVAALEGKGDKNAETSNEIKSKIKDPSAKLFSSEVSLLVKEYSSSEILSEVKQLDATSDKLFLLAKWASRNIKLAGAYNLIEYALKIAVTTTEYSPNAKIYNDLSTQLPFIDEYDKVLRIMEMFDTQQVNIQRSGPTEDYISLQLNMFKAHSKFGLEGASSRIIDLYFYINEINDISILAVGLAKLFAVITDTDPSKILEKTEGLHSTVERDLNNQLELLIENSASHFHETKNIISALARSLPEKGLDLIGKINTEFNRDSAYLEFVISYLDSSTIADYSLIYEVNKKITDAHKRDVAILSTFEHISNIKDELENIDLSFIMYHINTVSTMHDLEKKIKCYCIVYSILIDSEKYKGLAEIYLNKLKSAWEAIDLGWTRIDIGYKIVELLANEELKELANVYLEMTENYQKELALSDEEISWSYKFSLLLTIRAYKGLVIKGIAAKKDFRRLEQYIEIIPSYGEAALIWNDLALKLYEVKKNEEFKELVRTKIKPLIMKISNEDARYKHHVITKIAPSLYLYHNITADDIFGEMKQIDKEFCYRNIATYLLHKKSPYDPIEGSHGEGGNLTFEEVVDICDLINKVSVDHIIYTLVKDIADTILTYKRREIFSNEQKNDIVSRLTKIVEGKLPNPNYIKHKGYLIICKAEILRIKPHVKIPEWENLIKKTEEIPNTSDQSLVLSVITGYLPKKKNELINSQIEKTEKIIEKIPTTLDRLQQFESLATSIKKIDKSKSRSFLRRAMEVSSESNDEKVYSVQRRIIDFAHSIDPEFATGLISVSDRDPARKDKLENQLDVLELPNKILKNEINTSEHYSNYVEATWWMLGSLNAKRIETVHMENTYSMLEVSSRISIDEAFPILSWVVENAVVRYSNTDHAVSYLRPLFESTIKGVDTCLKLSTENRDKIMTLRSSLKSDSNNSIIVLTGEREKALEYIRKWFSEELGDYIKINDPFFGPMDFELLQIIRSIKPKCHIQILTSRQHQNNEGLGTNFEEEYVSYWNSSYDQAPPDTTITIVGTRKNGGSPIHDRWWVTNGKGLRIGTSYNSIGSKKSEISVLSASEANEREIEIDRYLSRVEREFKEERLIYTTFDLY